MSRLPDHPDALPGETTWEHWDDDKVYLQSKCPAERCDQGLTSVPGVGAAFCGRCGGDGLVTRTVAKAPTVHIKVVAYDITCLPDDHPERRNFTLQVVCRNIVEGLWAVVDRTGYCLSEDGSWDYESLPSNRQDEWKKTHRFSRTKAIELATDAARKITIGPFTVEDMLQPDPWAARAERLA